MIALRRRALASRLLATTACAAQAIACGSLLAVDFDDAKPRPDDAAVGDAPATSDGRAPGATTAPGTGTPSDAGADADASRCDAAITKKCIDDDVWWISSCGVATDIQDRCTGGYVCRDAACVPNVVGTATLVSEQKNVSGGCRLFADGETVYWAAGTFLARIKDGAPVEKVWSWSYGEHDFLTWPSFATGDRIIYREANAIMERTISSGAQRVLRSCPGQALGTNGTNAFFDCNGTLYATPSTSIDAASPAAIATIPQQLYEYQLDVGGGYVHFRILNQGDGILRFCAVPETGGSVACNTTVTGGSGNAADCLDIAGTWTGSGDTFVCTGISLPTSPFGLKTFGATGGTRLLAAVPSFYVGPHLRISGDYLYFTSGTRNTGETAPARIRLDGGDRTFLGGEPMVVGDVAVVGSTTYVCASHEAVTHDARLYAIR